jgi:hypothetical protein
MPSVSEAYDAIRHIETTLKLMGTTGHTNKCLQTLKDFVAESKAHRVKEDLRNRPYQPRQEW